MTARADLWFVDSNVLLYRFDATNATKRRLAQDWLDALGERRVARLSWQVLNEFYDNATHKGRQSHPMVRAITRLYASWEPIGCTMDILERAWYWTDRAQMRHWDALILASAQALECRWLLSEDFQHGRKYGNVEVVDPFQAEIPSFLPE